MKEKGEETDLERRVCNPSCTGETRKRFDSKGIVHPDQYGTMHAFLTVGSTRFDALVDAALSKPVLSTLRSKGYTKLAVQCGNSGLDSTSSFSHDEGLFSIESEGISIELWKFKPSLQENYEQADLVISHAGGE